ncbi:unnamed protein product [Rotaria sordida]|uniref:Uncharacterized protein n=1 Tax=Rotaria sordida TaxID=392033 RepID=A0A814GMT6_9BILA|nr:unnamed protein product [Rotaria sordida]CAF0997027.1 unnamed protein product [Rotaria sordida]CAF0998676.1 unnamed protein product [Rotaria sordida]
MANQSEITLAWLDANIDNEENKITYNKLCEEFGDCMQFLNQSDFSRFRGRIMHSSRRLILIVSGKIGENLVPDIHEKSNILSIYVYCSWKEKHEEWSQGYSKVKVVTKVDDLISNIKSDYNSYGN